MSTRSRKLSIGARPASRHARRAGRFREIHPGRAERIGELWGYPESGAFAELLIDCEEDRTLRASLVGMLREGYRSA